MNGIVLRVFVRNSGEGVINLNYEFSNVDQCFEEEDAANTDNL